MKRLTKRDILTVPNLLSLLRLLLIPVIVLYYQREQYFTALALVVLSALTDIVDGRIARRYHLVSDVGIVLDPLADKLTQAALVACLIPRHPLLWLVMGLLVVKELFMLLFGVVVFRRTGAVNSARWYGKLNTAAVYGVMMLLILLPEIPTDIANVLICTCAALQVLAGILYGVFYSGILRSEARTSDK